MIRLRFFGRSRRATSAIPRSDALRLALDASLALRRADRPERQRAAIERETAKHHAAFVRDPIIRALRPDLVPNGEK